MVAGCDGSKTLPPAAVDLAAFEQELRASGHWAGGPWENFEGAGRNTLAEAISCGLNPDHVVLDIGAGSLRVGWWFFHYIDPTNYYAIEPAQERLDAAVELLGRDEIHTFYNMDFEFPAAQFDFVIARSIWTHAAKWMISKMLSEFAENAAPDGKFLTSVFLARTPEEDYMGDEWVGDHGKPGVVRHSLQWLMKECQENELLLEVRGELYDQTWLLITPR